MDVSDTERAKRNHPVPAAQLLAAMEAVVEQKRQSQFLQEFQGDFVLSSPEDVKKLRDFLAATTPDASNHRLAAALKIVRDRCT